MLEGLLHSVGNIETEIENLTKSEQAGVPEQILNVVSSLNDYFDRIASKYPASFNIEKIGFEKDLNIKISPKEFMELLDNIVGNAVRHGFIGNRKDYLLQIAIEATDDNMCEIAIANNGEPMSERARTTFLNKEVLLVLQDILELVAIEYMTSAIKQVEKLCPLIVKRVFLLLSV